jgi:hypothetical protein
LSPQYIQYDDNGLDPDILFQFLQKLIPIPYFVLNV